MPPLLPRFHAFQQRIEEEQRIAKAILEAEELTDGTGSMPLRRSADGHDPARLRGLPAIGRNVSGAIQDTDPLRALLRKEARGEFRHRNGVLPGNGSKTTPGPHQHGI